ncbi:MAG: GNAT family N-acetyltransferase [Myxococcales bacterium]|nr:GNAT family N-acetyltransferase [Myxococcales bacterium]
MSTPRSTIQSASRNEANSIAINSLRACDLTRAGDLLAAAFRDNPLTTTVIGPDPARRLRSNRHGMHALLPVAQREGLVLGAHCGASLTGVLIAVPPFAFPLPPAAPLARARCVLGQGWRVAACWRRIFDHLAGLHPPEPHWYLGALGVDPSARRRGTGRALVQDLLARALREQRDTYLETDLRENLAFYEHLGFRSIGQTQVLNVQVWRMLHTGTSS